MTNPRLAMCNFISDPQTLKRVALDHGLSGIDWSFDLESLPSTPSEESQWARRVSLFAPLEPFKGAHSPLLAAGLATVYKIRRVPCGEDSPWLAAGSLQLRYHCPFYRIDLGHAHVCEAVRSRYYTAEDFVTPHSERVHNAHVYHAEISGLGHVPPDNLEDVVDRLDLLDEIGCPWWVLEVRNLEGLLQTKSVVEEYLTRSRGYGASRDRETPTGLASKGLEGSR